jgi:histone-lysine N-methyltransferase SETMAR
MTQQREFASAFLYSRGMFCCHTVARGKTVKGEYIIEVMKRFLKFFKRKRPEIAASPWLFHWDNAPVHTANNVTKFLAKKNIRTLQHPPYSPDLAPADYCLFRRLKSDLAGVSVTPETFKTELERVLRSIGKNKFAEAFQRRLHSHEKCIALQGGYVEKS